MSYGVVFERVELDLDAGFYRSATGEKVLFSKLLHVRLNGELLDLRLSFTTEDGVKLPCLRLPGGEKVYLDHEDLEIASDCISPTK